MTARFLQHIASAATSQCLPTKIQLRKGHNRRRSILKESSLWKRTGGCRQSLSQPTQSIRDLHTSRSHSSPFSTSTTGSLSPTEVCQLLLFWRPSPAHIAMAYLSKSLGVGEMRPCWQHCHCRDSRRRQVLGWRAACSCPRRTA